MNAPSPACTDALLRALLEVSPDFVLTADRQGRILWTNRAEPPLKPADFVGVSVLDCVDPEDRPKVQAALDAAFERGAPSQYETRRRPAPDLSPVWYSVHVGPVWEAGSPVAALFAANDLTFIRAEQERSRELVDRLTKISSQVPGVVFQFKLRPDGTSCFPYASDRIREIYRIEPDEVRADASKVFAILHPDDYAGIVDSITDSARRLEPWQYEYRVKFPDGDVRWLYGNSLPQREPDGSTLWHGFITDVTDRKRADQVKADLEAQLRHSQRLESIGRLAGGVAHDFNNLLTTVLGFTELARQAVPRGSDAARHLDRALEAARRGAGLTQQLLSFARKRVVKLEPVDLNDALRRLAPLVRRLIGEHLELGLDTCPGAAVVRIDLAGLDQIVMNLAVNARDAMPQGGRLTIATSPGTGDRILLRVRDTGTGIPPEVRARLFEPFFTTKPVGQGTGLGLAVCHGIVRQAGGDIEVESEPGRGTMFTISLPRTTQEAPAPVQPNSVGIALEGREALLLVEDEAMILEMARMALEPLGYRVHAARDGPAALALAASIEGPIDLLITDVIMPRMGGRELASRLQAERPGLQVLFASGYTDDAIGAQGVLENDIEFLQKPYTPATLAARIRQILDAR